MKSYRKNIQTKILQYGSLREIIKKNGVITIIDFAISNFLNLISKRFYRSNSANYGLSEAFFRSRGIDRWSRYMHVANEIQKNENKSSVLDVGAGGQGISGFLSPKRSDLDFLLFDVRKDAFKGLKGAHCVVGDGCRLPFRDKAFDITVSVDAVEHIPKSIRHNFYKEAKRVTRKKIILTCPMQSSDGEFQGKKYDIIFQSIYEKNYGAKEPNTAQHIEAFHPTLEEIKWAFPDSIVYGYKNVDIWLKYMVISSKPLIGLFCGMLYYLFWKKNDDKPPYWGAIIAAGPKKQQKIPYNG
jgi:ubiquinone/menaquinone biosynthesis C-methylase UbiE